MSKPLESHIDSLMTSFRTMLPRVSALVQFMPDDILQSMQRELDILSMRLKGEADRRRGEGDKA